MATSNTFGNMKPNFKEAYMSKEEKKEKRFRRTKTLIQPQGKATAELDASKNPMGYMESHKNMSIKNKKGVAF